MQRYEEMFFNDKTKLEEIIVDYIGKSLLYKHDDNPAERKLREIKKQVDFSYTINASAEFTLDYNTVDASAEFTDTRDFKEFKAKENERCLVVSDLEKWISFEPFEFGELSVYNPGISVEFNGVSETASTEAQVKWEEIDKVQRKEFTRKQTEARLEMAKKQIERLQKQIIEDEREVALAIANAAPVVMG